MVTKFLVLKQKGELVAVVKDCGRFSGSALVDLVPFIFVLLCSLGYIGYSETQDSQFFSLASCYQLDPCQTEFNIAL